MKLVALLNVLLVGTLVVPTVKSDHVRITTDSRLVSRRDCSTSSSRSCSGWWIFKSCSTSYYLSCVVNYFTENYEVRTCEDGWTGLPNCNTPVCLNCKEGQTCINPGVCDCLKTGSTCTNVACSETISCYPGTCIDLVCKCPTLFSGSDCQQSSESAIVKSCEITFKSTDRIIGKTYCAPSNVQPETLWINSAGLDFLQLSSEVEFKSNFPFPNVAYVQQPIQYGIAEAGFQIKENSILQTCPLFNNENPQKSGLCLLDVKISTLGLSTRHGNGFNITSYARVGGNKIGSKASNAFGSTFSKQYFTGGQTSRSSSVKFDNNAPTHCLNNAAADCPTFPIYLKEDIISDPTIQAEVQRWEDADSGVSRYHIDVYKLQPGGASNELENVVSPVWSNDLQAGNNVFSFNLNNAGVYSIELTVFDQANNSAKARNIFIFTNSGNLKVDETKPITIEEIVNNDKNSKTWWVTNANALKPKYFTLLWKDYFISNSKFNDEWNLPVKPLKSGIDDLGSFKKCYGQRNISRFNGLQNGITNYEVAYYVDNFNAGAALNFADSRSYDSTVNRLRLNYTEDIRDGGTLAIQLSCMDVVGAKVTEHLFVRVDTSPPEVYNYTFLVNYPNIYTSSVSFLIKEQDSGLKLINFSLYDGINQNPFKSGSVEPKLRDPPNKNKKIKREVLEGECTESDSTCYCSTLGKCYNYFQTVEIDHCWLDRIKIEQLEMRISAINNAGVSSSEKIAKLNGVTELSCRPGVLILFAILVVIIIFLVRIYMLKKPMPKIMNQAVASMRIMANKSRTADPVSTQNELYSTSLEVTPPSYEQPDQYFDAKDGYIYTDRGMNNALINLSKESLNMKEVISRGKLMVINRASINDDRLKIGSVAVKSLKNGANSKEKDFMNTKVKFFSNLKTHENIVKFIATVQGPYGAMIVMEYCEMPLTKWLEHLEHVTPEVSDEIITFALNISKGVEHLHKCKIVHKRLSVKNVLLTKEFNQYVAKLIGFGPVFDEKASVPVKWLAPETLQTINCSSPTYSNKSDAWSYAITLWEIYTRGSSPYPNTSSHDAMDAIIAGLKMDKPDDCPLIIYEDVMKKCWSTNPTDRPAFSEIVSKVTDYRQGGSLSPPGYYDTGEMKQGCGSGNSGRSSVKVLLD
ncbi:hypothetical protein HELRODRAFT_176714 [Helobdella robusta]|uniref:Protein kinase domain-containing protein n=1 Tax=Helobdella robusta TaxID=6412 RepID=T1FAT5_HELRO|nr:hypothetical protein HELRODRAFT_176714 [Helobdella robusta]ESN99547.1 hypothetical protein HELRODRAFT_176714 [Helobdella robusta]